MFIYAALGDSITFGQNASSIRKTFPSRIASMLNATELELDPSPLRLANAVSLWIGGDDLVRGGQLLQGSSKAIDGVIRQFEKRLVYLLVIIRAMGLSNIICCTQYNPFPNSPIAVKAIETLNRAIIGTAMKYGCSVARTDHWFSGKEALLIDGYRSGTIEEVARGITAVHPNDAGHNVIAKGLLPFVYPT
jgi:hypothetical protein